MNTAPQSPRHRDNPLARLGSSLEGILRSRRRGTFLVLVVGTLAMLSIIMIVYVAVGNSDRRTSSAVVRRNRSNEIVDLFADYVGQVLADDVLASVKEKELANALGVQNAYSRETWDAPRTNWFTDSSITDPNNDNYFRPFGLGDDPWLASTTPTWINYTPQTNSPQRNDKTFTKRVDWLHITNIAPDGRFVNLANLRDAFDAQPGSSSFRMSSGLSPGNNNRTGWGAAAGSLAANPSTFDSWQVGTFVPAKGPFAPGLTPNEPLYPPNQWADADGDGWLDSRWFEMVDARAGGNIVAPTTWRSLVPSDPNYRWFFAARIIDLSSLVNVNVATDLNANPNDPKTLTSIDASAFDESKSWAVGTQVIGRSPADVDLRRLLTMRDFREMILGNPPTAPGVAPLPVADSDSIPVQDVNPTSGSLANVNRDYRGGYSAIRQPSVPSQAIQDYTKYNALRKSVEPLNGLIGTRFDAPHDVNFGLGAYGAIRSTVTLGRAPGRFADFFVPPLNISSRPLGQGNFRWDTFAQNAGPIDRPVFRSAADGVYRPDAGYDFGLGFRVDSLIELLTYRGINDPRVTSALEAAAGGRARSEFDASPTTSAVPLTFSPLRENRSLELEREFLAGSNGVPTEAALLKAYTDVRQYLTTMSGARPLVSTLSNNLIDPDFPSALDTNETSVELSNKTGAPALFRGFAAALMPGLPPTATGTAFDSVWNAPTDPKAQELRGMFYGHQGPFTALLTSAHLAANFLSAAKPSTDASRTQPYTVVLAENSQTDSTNNTLPTNTGLATAEGWRRYFPAWWIGNQFNLARTPTSRNVNGPVRRLPAAASTSAAEPNAPVPAVNVYGIGATHPFIVGVATYTVYRDVGPFPLPPLLGVDIEGANGLPTTDARITINGYISESNPDFMYRVFAVQLHNPSSTPITLTSGPFDISGTDVIANTGTDFFYIRAGSTVGGSRYFVLADVEETVDASARYDGKYTVKPVTMEAGETIVFYAFNQDRKSIVEQRLNRSAITNPPGDRSNADLEAWLTQQLGKKTDTKFRRIQMLRVQDADFESATRTPARSTFRFDDPNSTIGMLVPNASRSDDVVQLFRAVRMDGGTVANDTGSGANLIANDWMCDRIRAGSSSVTLDRSLRGVTPSNGPQTGLEIDQLFTQRNQATNQNRERTLATVGPLPFVNDPTKTDYNSRLTVAVATLIRRPNDPAGTGLSPGQLPAWAVSPKDDDTWNYAEMVPDPSQLSNGKLTFASLNGATGGAPWRNRFATFKSADWKLLDPIFPDMANRAGYSGSGVNAPSITSKTAAANFDKIRREFASNGRSYLSSKLNPGDPDRFQARPADLLATIAVGPYEAPINADGNEIIDLNKRWTTTAEALALAFGFSKKPTDATTWTQSGNKYGPLDYYYYDRFTTAANPPSLFDAGYLKFDDYVCSRITDTASGTPKYYPVGTGAPIAANLLSMFRTTPDRFAGLTAATPGLVNINTAPIPVLRVLPLASPAEDYASYKLVNPSSTPPPPPYPPGFLPTLWPKVRGEDANVAALRSDFAAMIESYRDKIAVELRPGARNPGNLAPGTSTPFYSWFAPFIDRSTPGVTASVQRVAPNSPAIGNPAQLPNQYSGGRYWTSGIPGIREEAGFRSLAELPALRSVQVTQGTLGAQAEGRNQPINIDFLGHQDAGAPPTNILGIDNVLELTATTDSNNVVTVSDAKALQFANTQQDRLKVIAALGGSVTVRSDMYAAWFIIRGYTRTDVTGLSDDQPMVPSVERRFLMLIDRSNVTKPGQKPRIVAMVELPL